MRTNKKRTIVAIVSLTAVASLILAAVAMATPPTGPPTPTVDRGRPAREHLRDGAQHPPRDQHGRGPVRVRARTPRPGGTPTPARPW